MRVDVATGVMVAVPVLEGVMDEVAVLLGVTLAVFEDVGVIERVGVRDGVAVCDELGVADDDAVPVLVSDCVAVDVVDDDQLLLPVGEAVIVGVAVRVAEEVAVGDHVARMSTSVEGPMKAPPVVVPSGDSNWRRVRSDVAAGSSMRHVNGACPCECCAVATTTPSHHTMTVFVNGAAP